MTLNVARKLYETANKDQKYMLEKLFPQLQESEDERIIDEIITALKWANHKGVYDKHIAWLEKQGEKEYIDPDTLIQQRIDEEKAKAYDEALTKARNIVSSINVGLIGKDSFEAVFPELKESENERTRKEIIDFIYDKTDTYELREKSNSWLAWLEKQGEQKPTDKIEPKFKVGDWILYSGDNYEGVRHITKIDENGYYIERNGFKKWTLFDAKDGDILDANGAPFIYKKHDNDYDTYLRFYVYFYCGVSLGGAFIEATENNIWDSNNKVYPATKEQCDFLFQKMKEAGYEWDAENKELKKIKQKPADKIEPIFNIGDKIQYSKGCGTIFTIEKIENGKYIFSNNMGYTTIESGNKFHLVNTVEQKPVWSEEDKNFMLDTLSNLTELEERYGEGYGNVGKCIDWLKSLKDRIKGE